MPFANGGYYNYDRLLYVAGLTTSIDDISMKEEESYSANWYSIDGRRLNSVGTGVLGDLQSPVPARLAKGLYIHNGRKVLVQDKR